MHLDAFQSPTVGVRRMITACHRLPCPYASLHTPRPSVAVPSETTACHYVSPSSLVSIGFALEPCFLPLRLADSNSGSGVPIAVELLKGSPATEPVFGSVLLEAFDLSASLEDAARDCRVTLLCHVLLCRFLRGQQRELHVDPLVPDIGAPGKRVEDRFHETVATIRLTGLVREARKARGQVDHLVATPGLDRAL